MARYAYVENDQVLELYDYLPDNWRNISGFKFLASSIEELNARGWYMVQQVPYTIDPDIERLDGYDYTFSNGLVTETARIVSIPVIRRKTFSEKKQEFMQELRDIRNSLLDESDWTQLPDVLPVRNQSWLDSWKTYRQALRDLPAVYKAPEPTVKIRQVVWPEKPPKKL